MTTEQLLIVAGALAGGLVNGLTGFGTGMTALVLWLHALPVTVAATLVLVCSTAAQLQSLPSIWHALNIKRLTPFLIGGLAGIPLGTWLLVQVSVGTVKFWVGLVVTIYCSVMLLGSYRPTVQWGGRVADAIIGLVGGILGGLAGLSGPSTTIWASLRGWTKDERRAVFQGFNLTVLSVSLMAHAAAGLMTAELGHAALFALPGTLIGAFIGQRIYRRLDDLSFDRLVLAILLVAGIALLWSAL
ncbi:MAG: sulfite exporter TauE/SafE family protein [Hyphomicrobiaceae bacterium]